MGDVDGAIADYTRAIELDPRELEARVNRGNLRAERKEYDLAIADYSNAIAANPKFPMAYYNRANAHFIMGSYDRAIDDYAEALKVATPAWSLRENAQRRLEEAKKRRAKSER